MPTTLTPFLYQTGTLSRFSRAAVLRAGLHTTSTRAFRRGDEDIPFELPPDLGNDRRGLGHKKDTITPTERIKFEEIFREIAKKGRKPKEIKTDAKRDEGQTDEIPSILKALLSVGHDSQPGDDPSAAVSAIIGDAASRYTKSEKGLTGLDALSPLQSMYSAAEREKALLRFPPTLRGAARKAFGMLSPETLDIHLRGEDGTQQSLGTVTNPELADDADPVEAIKTQPTPDALAKTVEVEAKRREERRRIKAQMDAANDDFELWEVIEREVFSLVDRMGMAETSAQAIGASGIKRKGFKRLDPSAQPPLDMETYGPIYPQLLYDSLELLDSKFSRPSPFVAHLLPRVKDLGLLSYVLGVSTTFYNRLMEHMWNRYGDAQGVMNLLEEMAHTGLYTDETTMSVVHQIEAVYTNAESGQGGKFVQRLMKMPEYEPILATRLRHWIVRIDRSIRERKMGLSF
ncbi:hypothetical protein BD289DRAFT_378164 [Coniella lustricola]|uniref:Mtf2-like C-terminal domain-containing protein n=1 Tax=Coniella lustricola TaxID=2025994 RepID=A0A2T2ZUI1_9PEZI|nr:hypothetical protein BD289DRAFT_378164 [Coniella lustricola]